MVNCEIKWGYFGLIIRISKLKCFYKGEIVRNLWLVVLQASSAHLRCSKNRRIRVSSSVFKLCLLSTHLFVGICGPNPL